MASVLLTAFEPYGRFSANASQLTLDLLAVDMPSPPQVTTSVLPVDFALVKARLADELTADYDYVLLLGQAPGASAIRLEKVALNIACEPGAKQDWPLCHDGPLAYRSWLPLHNWERQLRDAGIPAEVSYHAGTYLCNAALYLTHHFAQRMQLKTKSAFIHLPLDPSQREDEHSAYLPAAISATAIRLLLADLVG